MKKNRLLLVLLGASFVAFLAGYQAYPFFNPFHETNVLAVFSPESTEFALLDILSGAQKSVFLTAYQFSYAPLREALISAAKRGVDVRVILDRGVSSNLFTAEQLENGGVSVRWAADEFASTHSKSLVADGVEVFVGSPNWSRHAMHLNREAAAWIRDKKVASDFIKVFESDWGKATPWNR